ncbi:MAG: hypothetical protein JW910_04785 [Anaerolineae bacterium]|nr:hypothetical protein [Anaerolineae bacterium]
MPPTTPEDTTPGQAASSRPVRSPVPLWVLVALALAVVVCGAVIIARVAAPLVGLISPPDVPVFPESVLIEQRTEQVGVDEYLYAVDATGCDVYAWYEIQADLCRQTPGSGCSGTTLPPQDQVYSVGYCQGGEPFGDFSADWEVWISAGYNDDGDMTHYLLVREIDWINQDE